MFFSDQPHNSFSSVPFPSIMACLVILKVKYVVIRCFFGELLIRDYLVANFFCCHVILLGNLLISLNGDYEFWH